jgi:hypothetical protein
MHALEGNSEFCFPENLNITKHLMYAPSGNSEFCFPSNLNVSRDENKIHYFPREHTLSALLYRVSQKKVMTVICITEM